MSNTFYILICLVLLTTTLFADYRWEEVTPMNVSRMGHAAVAHEGFIYVFGGVGSNWQMSDSVEVYNPENRTWQVLEPMPIPLYQASAVSYDRYILIIGGQTIRGINNQVFLYSPRQDSYAIIARMPEPYRFGHANVRVEQRILVVGGYSERHGLVDVGYWYYPESPDSNYWTEAPRLLDLRANFGLVVRDSLIWAVGGFNIGGHMDQVELMYGDRWIESEPMPTARGGLGSAFLGDILFVAGGRMVEGPGTITGLVEGFDLGANEWIEDEIPAMNIPRMDFTLVELGDTLYAIGGTGMRRTVFNEVEIFYSFENDVSETLPPLPSSTLLSV